MHSRTQKIALLNTELPDIRWYLPHLGLIRRPGSELDEIANSVVFDHTSLAHYRGLDGPYGMMTRFGDSGVEVERAAKDVVKELEPDPGVANQRLSQPRSRLLDDRTWDARLHKQVGG